MSGSRPGRLYPLGKRLPVPTGCVGLRAAQTFLRTGKFLLFYLRAISLLLLGVKFILPGRPARGPATVLTELSLFPTVLQMGHICISRSTICQAPRRLAATFAGQRGQWRSQLWERSERSRWQRGEFYSSEGSDDMWNKHLSTDVWARLYLVSFYMLSVRNL